MLAEEFDGLDRFEARKPIVARLEEFGFLDKIEPLCTHGAARRSLRRGHRAVAD